jgi:hypothetical protein
MIDIEKCKIEIKLYPQESNLKAFVTFIQGSARFSGFLIKDGKYGTYLDAPKISRRYIYFDENRARWDKIQEKALEQYSQLVENASIDDIQSADSQDSDEEIDLDKIPF